MLYLTLLIMGAATAAIGFLPTYETAGIWAAVLLVTCRLIQGYSEDWVRTPFYGNEVVSQLVSAALFVGLCAYLWYGSLRRSRDDKEEA